MQANVLNARLDIRLNTIILNALLFAQLDNIGILSLEVVKIAYHIAQRK